MIEIKDLVLHVPTLTLNKINISIKDWEYFILLGPTGSGKSLLLDVIAGAYKPDAGKIVLDGKNITYEKPERRDIGYVPQDYTLFNNMTVLNNLIFGLRAKHVPRAEAITRVMPLIKMLNLQKLLNKKPEVLSGGEKQKIALARALAVSPKLLLLDEPLQDLDYTSKEQFMYELKRMHKEYTIPIIHVTHDRSEAIELADRVGLLHNGTLEQVGTFNELHTSPKTEFVARFVGNENIIQNAELNRYLHVPAQTKIAFAPENVILSNTGLPVTVTQITRLEKSFKITGMLFDTKITIKSNVPININNNIVKIKIKKFVTLI